MKVNFTEVKENIVDLEIIIPVKDAAEFNY